MLISDTLLKYHARRYSIYLSRFNFLLCCNREGKRRHCCLSPQLIQLSRCLCESSPFRHNLAHRFASISTTNSVVKSLRLLIASGISTTNDDLFTSSVFVASLGLGHNVDAERQRSKTTKVMATAPFSTLHVNCYTVATSDSAVKCLTLLHASGA